MKDIQLFDHCFCSRAVFAHSSYHFSYFFGALASIFSACLNVRHPHKGRRGWLQQRVRGREGQPLWKTFMGTGVIMEPVDPSTVIVFLYNEWGHDKTTAAGKCVIYPYLLGHD